jgi:hypothetical protein
MSYTAGDFARELLGELQKGYDVVQLSRWAMATCLKHSHETEPELDSKIMDVVAMEDDPQFEMTERELWEFAERLMA